MHEDIGILFEELGERRSQRRVLLKLLTLRFGVVPEAVVARMNNANEAQLDTWLERLVTAMTVDEIFAD